ncbi:MAG: glycosyltransferase family 1 protein [Treponema sp.]|jgi:glycosyltransferase involved in cell wall biosynthesis|nr:glycosyltransferase family 1 protein [Treponema sp.]
MRIAYFTDTYMPEINGVTNTLSRLEDYLQAHGIGYAIFAPAYDGNTVSAGGAGSGTAEGPYKTLHRFKGFTTRFSPESRLAFPSFREIDRICDRYKPGLVHVITELGVGIRGMRYAVTRDIPLVMSYHTDYCRYLGYFGLEPLKPLLEKYLAWFYGFSCRTLVPSRHTLGELFAKGYRNLGLWSRGIDTDRFNPACRSAELRDSFGKGKFIFLYAGRLSPEKGLDMLLYAAEEIERRFPGKAAFVFTGSGPCEAIIRRGNLPNVFVTGFMRGDDLSRMYASADCFAFPSGTETFGNAALEAMASGLPVAGVASGGVTDFLSHGHNALLCAMNDRKAYTENLTAIMEDAALRGHLAANARTTALSRGWGRVFDGLINGYNMALEEYQGRRWKAAS